MIVQSARRCPGPPEDFRRADPSRQIETAERRRQPNQDGPTGMVFSRRLRWKDHGPDPWIFFKMTASTGSGPAGGRGIE